MLRNLILVALFASVALARNYPVFNRSCDERKEEMVPNVKEAFNVAAVS